MPEIFSRLCRLGPLFLSLVSGLSGCAYSNSPALDFVSAAVSERWGSSRQQILNTALNPSYRYLRVDVQGRAPALLVLGYVDAHPQGEIEVWYSAKNEIIKLQNGRIVGTAGLEIDWRSVRFPAMPPAWSEVLTDRRVYQRQRDEMPGYRYAITDQVESASWRGLPPIALPESLPPAQAAAYVWLRETTTTSGAQSLPPAWFAWGIHRGLAAVVYSEQCLSASFCLKLQRWPVPESVS